MVKAIIFDLWGTIVEQGVHPSPSKQVKRFLRVDSSFPEFVSTFESSFMTSEFESLKAGFEQVVKDFGVRIPDFVYDKMIGMWNKNAILSEMYEDVRSSIEDLRKDYKVFLLSNIDKFSYDQVNTKFDIESLFDATYPSFKTGLLKSDKKSFEKIMKDNKLKSDDVLMVGDCLSSDIATAENAGVKGLLVDRRDSREHDYKVLSLAEIRAKLEE